MTVTAMERVQTTGRSVAHAPASQPARAAGRPHPDRADPGRGLFLRPGHPSVDLRRHRRASVLARRPRPPVRELRRRRVLDLPLFAGVRPVPVAAVRPAVRGVLRPVDGRLGRGAVLARAAVAVGPADPVPAVDVRAVRRPGPPVHRRGDRARVPMAGVVGLQHPDQGHAGRRAAVVPRAPRVAVTGDRARDDARDRGGLVPARTDGVVRLVSRSCGAAPAAASSCTCGSPPRPSSSWPAL